VWKIASVVPDGSPAAEVLTEMLRAMERASAGRLKIVPRFGGTLGDEPSTLELCEKGKLEGWGGSAGILAERVNALTVLDLPFLFPDIGAVARGVRSDVLEGPKALAAFRAHG